MRKGLSVLLIAAALFGFYGGAVNLNDVLACKDYWEVKGEETTADMNKLEDGVNQLMTEQLVTEILVQENIQTAAVTAYVSALNLKGLKVYVALVLFKMVLYACAYSSIVRLCIKTDGQYDGQRRHDDSSAPEHVKRK